MSKKYATQFDKMTQMPVEKLVMILGLPTTISMMVTTFYSMADTYFVGKLGTSATGAIGIVFPLMAVIQAIGFMLGHGSGSNIARLLGAKDPDTASDFASTAVFVGAAGGIVMLVSGMIFIDPLMNLLGSSDTILPFARAYGSFVLFGIPGMIVSFILNNILRYEGRATLAMIGLLLGGLLNVVGDWLTITVFGMGIEGAGISTMLSSYVGMGILLSMFLRKKTVTRLQLKRVFKNGKNVISIIITGLPSLARQGMSSLSTATMNILARPYGDAAIAAMSIVMRLSFMLFAIGLGIGQGFQPVCGFNYGAKKYDRVKRASYFTLFFSSAVLFIAAAGGWFLVERIIGLFRDDPDVINIGTPAMHYQLLSIVIVPVSFIGNMLFQSIGKSGRALFLSCLRNGICYIPVLLILTPSIGLLGIQIAQPISDVLTAAITLPFFISFLQKLSSSPSAVSDSEESKE